MKIVSFGPPHAEQPGVMVDDSFLSPLGSILAKLGYPALDTNALLAFLPLLQPKIEAVLREPGIAKIALGSVRLGSPVPKPNKIIVAGGNYQSHVDEVAGYKNAPSPSEPLLIFKPASIVIGPNDNLMRPAQSQQLDYETEICVVIGQGGSHILRDKAYDHIAGYMIGNDVTARDMAFKDVALNPLFSQITKAKAIRTGAPFGPWLATKDEIPDPHALQLRCWVNGELRQDGASSEMIVDIPALVEDFSKVVDLEPGDVIFTGTTTGCGAFQKPPRFLFGGDVVRMEITGLGRMETPIVDEPVPAAA